MEQIIALLTTVAKGAGISPALLIAVCTTETNLQQIHTLNDGPSTSYGVCQVKLETAQFMGKVHHKPALSKFTVSDMKDMKKSAEVAALYLKYQISRYNGNLCKATAAYNAGSYKESRQFPGVPFNSQYVARVKSNATDEKLETALSCTPRKYEFVASTH